MSFTPSNGTKFYISTTNVDETTDTPEEYAALKYTEVKGVTNLGEFGDSSTDVTSTELGDDRVQHAKGARDGGSPAIVCNNKPTDPGQQAMYDAEGQPFDYAFKTVFNDKLTPGGGGSVRYYRGKVMSIREGVGSANNPISVTFNVGINSSTQRVAAT
jgi:hypothetical protein